MQIDTVIAFVFPLTFKAKHSVRQKGIHFEENGVLKK